MKRYIFLIIILTAISPRFGFAQTAQQAAAAYANKNYPEAIELYQQLSKEQGVSSFIDRANCIIIWGMPIIAMATMAMPCFIMNGRCV